MRKVVVGGQVVCSTAAPHAESAAAIFSLNAWCRLHGVDTQLYVDEIMRVLGMHDKFDRRSSLRSNFLTAIGTRPGVSLRLTKRCSRTKGKVVLAREPTPATGSTLRATRGRPGDDQIDQAADEACVDRLSLPERAHVKRAE